MLPCSPGRMNNCGQLIAHRTGFWTCPVMLPSNSTSVFDYQETGAQQTADKRQPNGGSGSEIDAVVLRNIRNQLTHRSSSVAPRQENQNPRINRSEEHTSELQSLRQ